MPYQGMKRNLFDILYQNIFIYLLQIMEENIKINILEININIHKYVTLQESK